MNLLSRKHQQDTMLNAKSELSHWNMFMQLYFLIFIENLYFGRILKPDYYKRHPFLHRYMFPNDHIRYLCITVYVGGMLIYSDIDIIKKIFNLGVKLLEREWWLDYAWRIPQGEFWKWIWPGFVFLTFQIYEENYVSPIISSATSWD